MKMNRFIILVSMLIVQTLNAQIAYMYRPHPYLHLFESITLNSDGTFNYLFKADLYQVKIEGNWQIRDSTFLVLDSRPQKTKIKVFESYKENNIKIAFYVKNMEGKTFPYDLWVIKSNGKKVSYKNQETFSEIKEDNIKAFYIVCTSNGLRSPIYYVKNEGMSNYEKPKTIFSSKYQSNKLTNNRFDVYVETNRVFENEYWKYCQDYIIPLENGGEYAKYKLMKQ